MRKPLTARGKLQRQQARHAAKMRWRIAPALMTRYKHPRWYGVTPQKRGVKSHALSLEINGTASPFAGATAIAVDGAVVAKRVIYPALI